MNTFTWLVIGHLFGDWFFQNDWMARGKRERFFTWPGFVHFLVYSGVVLICLVIATRAERSLTFYALIGLLLLVSHWFLDVSDVVRGWMRFFGQTDVAMVRIMVDQSMHFLVLAVIALLA